MQRSPVITILGILSFQISLAQIKSGPMLGAVEYRTAKVWYELDRDIAVQLEYWRMDKPSVRTKVDGQAYDKFEFRIRTFYLTGLEYGRSYSYQLFSKTGH